MTLIDDKQTRNILLLGRLIVIGMIVQLMVIGYIFYANYEGRVDLVQAQRRGCRRGKLDRIANADGWRAAENARVSTAAKTLHLFPDEVMVIVRRKPRRGEIPDIKAARRFNRIADGLEKRAHIDCRKQFPDPEVFAT